MTVAAVTSRAHRGTADPIRAVSVISTGRVEIHPEHALGTRKPLYWWLLTSRRWLPPRPINVYVIEHAKGLLLFDTGQDRASVTDDSYFPGGFSGIIYNRLARFSIGEDETLDAQLGTLGYSTADVDTAVVSHLHQDHIGGIPELSSADLLVAEAEWVQLAGFFPEARGFLRAHIDIPGARWHRVAGEPTNDPILAPFTKPSMSWVTAHSSCSRHRVTRPARSRCWCGGARCRRSCWSATSPTTLRCSSAASFPGSVTAASSVRRPKRCSPSSNGYPA